MSRESLRVPSYRAFDNSRLEWCGAVCCPTIGAHEDGPHGCLVTDYKAKALAVSLG